MKYKYYFSVIQCNRLYSSFIRNCDLGIEDVGVSGIVSFITDKKPTDEYKEKMINILEKTKDEKSLGMYYTNVNFLKVEEAMEENDEKEK